MMKKLSIVSPVYNEEGNVLVFYNALIAVLKGLTNTQYEIVFVDDGSKDQSPLILAKLAIEDKNVKVITFSRNFGHQAAITAGIENATGDAVVILDSDMQDPPSLIPALYAKWLEGYEVINAKRKSRQDSFLKTTTAIMFYKILNTLLTNKIPENVGDYRLLDRKCVDVLKSIQEKDRYLRGLSTWIGFKQCEVEYDRDKRFSGSTHYTLSKMFNLAFDAIFSFSKLPMRLALFTAFMFLIVNILIIVYSLISWMAGHVVAGWTSVVFVTSLLGSLQMFVLAIISEYVGRIYTQTQNRPLYIISQKTNF
jgi:dolichol-phosphate mannosyltransferase